MKEKVSGESEKEVKTTPDEGEAGFTCRGYSITPVGSQHVHIALMCTLHLTSEHTLHFKQCAFVESSRQIFWEQSAVE